MARTTVISLAVHVKDPADVEPVLSKLQTVQQDRTLGSHLTSVTISDFDEEEE